MSEWVNGLICKKQTMVTVSDSVHVHSSSVIVSQVSGRNRNKSLSYLLNKSRLSQNTHSDILHY